MESTELRAAVADAQCETASQADFDNDLLTDASPSASLCGGHPYEPLSLASNSRYLLQGIRTALPLVISDQVALLSAVWLAAWVAHGFGVSGTATTAALGVSLGCGLWIAFITGELYPAVGLPTAVEVRQCTFSATLVFTVFLLAAHLYSPSVGSTVVLAATWLICLVLIPLCRYATRRACCRFRWWLQPVVIFGDSEDSRSLVQSLVSSPHLGLAPVGILDDLHAHWSGSDEDRPGYLGPLDAAPDVSRRRGVYRAIVAMPERATSEVHRVLEFSSEWFPHLVVIPKIQALPLLWTKTWHLGGHSGLQLRSRILLPVPRLMKRVMDLLVVVIGVPLIAPVMLLIGVAIKCSSRGPVFYAQERIGLGGRPFRAWKFRTMVADAENLLDDYLQQHPELHEEWENDRKLKNDPRVIPWTGHLLRRYSLDELPQLWNVLTGAMSLVGPRPLPQYHLDNFDEDFRRYREKIVPGLTGLWQVTCRSDGDLKTLVKWDRYYIRNWSFWLDLQILLRTFKVVVSGDGAY